MQQPRAGFSSGPGSGFRFGSGSGFAAGSGSGPSSGSGSGPSSGSNPFGVTAPPAAEPDSQKEAPRQQQRGGKKHSKKKLSFAFFCDEGTVGICRQKATFACTAAQGEHGYRGLGIGDDLYLIRVHGKGRGAGDTYMGPFTALSRLEPKEPEEQTFRNAHPTLEFPYEIRVAPWDVKNEEWKSALELPTTHQGRYITSFKE